MFENLIILQLGIVLSLKNKEECQFWLEFAQHIVKCNLEKISAKGCLNLPKITKPYTRLDLVHAFWILNQNPSSLKMSKQNNITWSIFSDMFLSLNWFNEYFSAIFAVLEIQISIQFFHQKLWLKSARKSWIRIDMLASFWFLTVWSKIWSIQGGRKVRYRLNK